MTTTNDTGLIVADHVIGTRGRVVVRLASAELRLVATDGDRVVVRTPTGRALPDRVVVETTDDGLTIGERETHGLTFSRGRRTVQLEIAAPPMAEVTIDTVSGWLDAFGLTGEQRYRTVSGEFRLRDGAGEIRLTTVSGDATIELAGAADLAIKSVSGDAVVRGGRLDALRVGTTSGDVRVDSPLAGRSGNTIETLSGDVSVVATAGIRVEARTISGDLATNLPHRSEGRMGRRTLIVGDGSIELGFRSVSGDLRIHDGTRFGTDAVPPTPPVAPVPPVPPTAFSIDLPDIDLPDIDLPDIDLPDEPAGTSDSTAHAGGVVEADGDPLGTARMAILRALERGELDVPTAMARLADLDGPADRDADPGREPAHG